MKRTEFSKKIIVFITIFTVIITAFSLALMWKTGDTSPLSYLIPSIFAEYATATGFYYHKARAENKIKLMQRYGKTAEKVFNEQQDLYDNGGI